MKVVAVDISDISEPRVIAEYPLSGRGDGVVARDGVLYASTGQHKRGIKNVVDKNDPNFGKGNGIEVFDVRDPENPVHIAWDFFSEGYSSAFDMWKPMLCGDTLICNCSILGVYGYDVNSLQKIFHISVPEKDGKADPVTGTASYGGKLYVSTGLGGLYMFDGLLLDDGYFYDEDTLVRSNIPELICEGVKDCELEQLYKGDFPVLAVDELCEKYLALATGERGIHIINSDSFELVAKTDTDGFCYDLKACGEYIFAAFGELGVKIFRFFEKTLEFVSSLDVGGAAQQVKTSENGHFLAVTVGGSEVKMLDMRNITEPKEIYCRRASEGPLYGENFLSHSFGGRGISLFWHRDGLVYSDPEGGDFEFHTIKFPLKNGFTGFCPGNGCDIVGDNILFAHKGGYILLPKDGEGFADEGPTYRTEDKIRGKFLIDGKYLIVTERAEGTITVTDIEDIKAPTRVAGIKINASPSKAVKTSRGIFIPSRFGGLLRLSYQKG